MQFDEHGLLPVVAQDHLTGVVRMVAFANERAVKLTLETGRATFWSRSRGELWEKGVTSGNAMDVKAVLVDCDADCLLYLVAPRGPTCHTGAPSCFFRRALLKDGHLRTSDAEVPPPTLGHPPPDSRREDARWSGDDVGRAASADHFVA